MPILSRVPRGRDWVMQYFPRLPVAYMDLDSIIGELLFSVIPGQLFFLVLAAMPSVIVFIGALKSKSIFYIPLVCSFLAAVIVSAYLHHDYDYDIYTYNLAGLAFIIFPIQISFWTGVAGVFGLVIEELFLWIRSRSVSK